MKINDISPVAPPDATRPGGRITDKNADFAKALSEASSGTANRSTAPAGEIIATHTVGALNAARAGAANRVETAVDLLERYMNALGDPSKTLKDVAPLVRDLEKQAGNLDALSRGLPDGHPLKDDANQIAVRAMVEAIKFNRGDYVEGW